MTIQFLGAAGTVTGSRTLLNYKGKKILVDCGLFQGPKSLRMMNWEPFIKGSEVDVVLLTHAHLDHCGYLPLLVKTGFRGPIYCTDGTRDLTEIILMDSARLQEEDAEYANRTGYSHHKPALPLYETSDARQAVAQIKPVIRDEWVRFSEGFQFCFRRAGHLLGASFIEVHLDNGNGGKKITFSGDLGSGRSYILKPPMALPHTDELILESTYGNRLHSEKDVVGRFEEVINKVLKRKGQILIPSFSVGRAQEVLYIVSHLLEEGRIPSCPIFLNSPMANKATEVYLKHPYDLQFKLKQGQLISPLCLSSFYEVSSPDESQRLVEDKTPKIVISASGMLTGGRVMHHLKYVLPDPKSALVFVGYQASETKGRLLLDGIKELRIHHQPYPVKAEIHSIDSLSSHADQEGLIRWARELKGSKTRIFLNHGEPEGTFALKKRIEEELQLQVVIPSQGQEFSLVDSF